MEIYVFVMQMFFVIHFSQISVVLRKSSVITSIVYIDIKWKVMFCETGAFVSVWTLDTPGHSNIETL